MPLKSLAMTSIGLGPGSNATVTEKLPLASTSTGRPLTDTTASGAVYPWTVKVDSRTTLSSLGAAISRKNATAVTPESAPDVGAVSTTGALEAAGADKPPLEAGDGAELGAAALLHAVKVGTKISRADPMNLVAKPPLMARPPYDIYFEAVRGPSS